MEHPSKTPQNDPRLASRMWQSTFQVTLTQPDGKISTPYHTRRAHKKSRTGCSTCKKRRVKCDERKPTCLRCENYGAPCSYASPPASSSSGESGSGWTLVQAEPDRTLTSLCVADMVSRVRDAVAGDLAFEPRAIGRHEAVISLAVNSFQHFLTRSTETVGSSLIRQVMVTDMIHVAFGNPYLMYAILGCGILHINRLSPGSEPRELAEAYFWQQAITSYSRALECSVSDKNVDGLISACMLMGTASIAPVNFRPQDSWVLTGRQSDLNWFALQGGLNCILKVAGRYLDKSIWGPAFSRSRDWEEKLYRYDIEQGREGLHTALADLCGIDELTTAETNPYYFPVKILSPLLELEVTAENASQCATWMGRLDPEFVDLLRRRDPRALVVAAYWMGLMCLISEWQPWVEGRIRQECVAICIYLEGLGDSVIRPFLEFPGRACGISRY